MSELNNIDEIFSDQAWAIGLDAVVGPQAPEIFGKIALNTPPAAYNASTPSYQRGSEWIHFAHVNPVQMEMLEATTDALKSVKWQLAMAGVQRLHVATFTIFSLEEMRERGQNVTRTDLTDEARAYAEILNGTKV